MKFYRIGVFLVLAGLVFYIYKFMYSKPAFMIGEKIPDFKGITIDGKDFDSESLRGKLTYLHFWGTWCGPCRKEVPQIAALYHTFSDTLHGTFQIVSVAMDDDSTKLRNIINQDSLNWPTHIREAKKGGPITELYKIREIPTAYLLNDQLQIIRVNPSMEELKTILTKVEHTHNSKARMKQAG